MPDYNPLLSQDDSLLRKYLPLLMRQEQQAKPQTADQPPVSFNPGDIGGGGFQMASGAPIALPDQGTRTAQQIVNATANPPVQPPAIPAIQIPSPLVQPPPTPSPIPAEGQGSQTGVLNIPQTAGLNYTPVPEEMKPSQTQAPQPQNYKTLQEYQDATDNYIEAIKAEAKTNQELANRHPSLFRRIIGDTLGIGAGIVTANPALGKWIQREITTVGTPERAAEEASQRKVATAQKVMDAAASVAKTGLDFQKTGAETFKDIAEGKKALYEISPEKFNQDMAKENVRLEAEQKRLEQVQREIDARDKQNRDERAREADQRARDKLELDRETLEFRRDQLKQREMEFQQSQALRRDLAEQGIELRRQTQAIQMSAQTNTAVSRYNTYWKTATKASRDNITNATQTLHALDQNTPMADSAAVELALKSMSRRMSQQGIEFLIGTRPVSGDFVALMQKVAGGGGKLTEPQREQLKRLLEDQRNIEFKKQSIMTAGSDAVSLAGDANEVERIQAWTTKQLQEMETGRSAPEKKSSPFTVAPPKGVEPKINLGPVRIQGDEDYNKLKSGTPFIGPDGVPRIKP